MNKYCGPAVLSILTGKSTDECASVISRINGQYKIQGVQLNHLLIACSKLNLKHESIEPSGSLYRTLTGLASSENAIYLIMVPGHFVVVEVKDKIPYFCDNHTIEPIPAASSARLLQKVVACYKITKLPKPELLEPKYQIEEVKVTYIVCEYCQRKAVNRLMIYEHSPSCPYRLSIEANQ